MNGPLNMARSEDWLIWESALWPYRSRLSARSGRSQGAGNTTFNRGLKDSLSERWRKSASDPAQTFGQPTSH